MAWSLNCLKDGGDRVDRRLFISILLALTVGGTSLFADEEASEGPGADAMPSAEQWSKASLTEDQVRVRELVDRLLEPTNAPPPTPTSSDSETPHAR